MESSAFKYQKEKSVGTVIAQLMFSHVGMFIVVALYTAFGAKMYLLCEAASEMARYKDKMYRATQIRNSINYNAGLLWFYGDDTVHNWTFADYNATVQNDLTRMENYILEAITNYNYDGTIEGWSYDWTFMNSLLLCMSIVTSIGYGNVVPLTYEGQMFTIVYSLIGLPLFLVFLANMGDGMAKGFIYLYSRCCCRGCRSRRYLSELPENVSTRYRKHVIDDVVGDEEYMPTSKLFVPITVNIVVLHLYFLVGTVLFSAWEGWSSTEAFYFTFVTLATIGFGDYVPGSSLTDSPDSLATTLKLLITVIYIVLGMALLSMCINLMQDQIIEKCKWMARKIGCSSNNNKVSEPKPVDRRKDSLAPLMQDKLGPSPFRNSDLNPAIDEEDVKLSGPLPGILGMD